MPYGQVFAEKGFENVFLLSGGVESFLETYPECVEGAKVPVLPKKQCNPLNFNSLRII